MLEYRVCLLCQIMFVLNIRVIDFLNKIWNYFQVSFYIAQGFHIVREHMEHFFPNTSKVMSPPLITQIHLCSSCYTQ
jgi:hypothetical protein